MRTDLIAASRVKAGRHVLAGWRRAASAHRRFNAVDMLADSYDAILPEELPAWLETYERPAAAPPPIDDDWDDAPEFEPEDFL